MSKKEIPLKKLKTMIEKSGLFDRSYYLKHNSDARLADEIPIDHYCKVGIQEDRKPNANFDSAWYKENYQDVKEDGAYPLVHYIISGRKENRFQSKEEQKEYEILKDDNFDIEFYKNNYEDLKTQGEEFDFILHYIRYGKNEGRVYKTEHPVSNKDIINEVDIKIKDDLVDSVEKINKNIIFDMDYYLENNKDVAEAGIDPELHYLKYGEREGRRPNKYFNPDFYYQLNADVRMAGISAFNHYIQNGFYEGRLGDLQETTQRKVSSSAKPILFVGHDAILAGAQVVLLEVVRWFYLHTNREIKILLLDTGPMSNSYVEFGEVYVLHNREVDDAEKFKSFLNEEFEFVYLNTVVSGYFLKLIRENDIKLHTDFISNIHEMEKVLDIYSDELSELLPEVKHWISGSPETTKVLIEKYNVAPKRLTTVPAFINPIVKKDAQFNTLKEEARNTLNLEQDAFIVTGCGTAYWRKGPDIFVETAKELKKITQKNIQFVWIGDGEDKDKLESSLSQEEQTYIKFVGHQTNASLLLAAGDIFFLSSREDPFPLVVLLSAQHYIPTICFEEATGITQFVKDDAGICLPSIDVKLASNAINKLIEDSKLLNQLAIKAQERVFSSYTTEQKMIEIFNVIKDNTSYKPSVSVVVPFYNHEKFIDERLNSILNQNIKDIEIIALDDCSTDNSVLAVEKYLIDPRVKIFTNEINSGSPFKQWKKGIELAKSDIIWIAEGDDSASIDFIDHLLPYFDDILINIAVAKTEIIDEHGNLKENALKAYFDSACKGKFDSNYIKSGVDEVNEQLGAVSTLVNASGLLIRKSSFGNTVEDAQSYKMCGDWLIYLECLKNGKIVYDIDAINYFRRHSTSQVHKIEGSDTYFLERKSISEYVFENYKVSKQLIIKAFEAVDHEWSRFKHKHSGKELLEFYNKKELFDKAQKFNKEKLPSIVVVASDFSPGGGQLFSIRLANAWKKIGGEVILLNVGKFPDHSQVLKQINSTIPTFRVDQINISDLMNVFDIDIIHSSIWWADKYVHEIYKDLPKKVRWVISMHGCYETLIDNLEEEPNFMQYFENMLFEVDSWVYTAEKNKKIFNYFYEPQQLTKVLNGYEPEKPKYIDKESIGIRSDSFVFCLASRAISAKGWHVAIEAVKKLNSLGHKVDLLLIGEGEAADEIKNDNKTDFIHLTGQVSNLEDYIALCDVGILPTAFIGESMPLILLEFMAQGKPIISTNIGEIVDMTTDEHGSSALILELENGDVNTEELVEAMQKVYNDKEIIEDLSINSKRIFKRFEMSNMINAYKSIYVEIIND